MKKIGILLISIFSVYTHAASLKNRNLIHILPDAPSSYYRLSLKNQNILVIDDSKSDNSVESVIKLGERNMNWLKYMNSLRDEAHQLRLTKPGELTAVPITSPKKYNPKIIAETADSIKSQIPQGLKEVLYSNTQFPENPSVSDDVYIEWARKIDKNYQTAARWMMMVPYLNYLKEEAQNDIRGYFFLSHTENIENKLRSFSNLLENEKSQITEWLIQICRNNEGLKANCESKVNSSISNNKVYEIYLRYVSGSEKLWDSYFSLSNPRQDMQWTSVNPLTAILPFLNPNNDRIMNFLKINIEDEWKWNDWRLNLNFQNNADVHVEFKPGVTPHVNGLGGNTIVMDENTPLTEWDVQWTIRHEFGHVLGFTDCYVEFYDSQEKAIINYQLDIDNLMCSRRGRMQETHYTTLRSAYFK